jgi:hypothetical protein
MRIAVEAVFPAAGGRFLFGPMAIIGWGPKTLIMLEIGLVLELPEPMQQFSFWRPAAKVAGQT